jgi:hypothetical protein
MRLKYIPDHENKFLPIKPPQQDIASSRKLPEAQIQVICKPENVATGYN